MLFGVWNDAREMRRLFLQWAARKTDRCQTLSRSCAVGLCFVRRWREAITLVENMRGDGLTPDEYSYAGCIDACAKALQWKKACQLLDEMRAAGVQVRCFACLPPVVGIYA